MEDSNYKWGVRKFNSYECGVTTLVTPSLWNLFSTLYLWVMDENGKA